MDGRAREHVRARRLLAASDLIFADGLELTQKVAASIEQARVAAIAASDAALVGLRRREIFSLGAAAATALLILLLLLPVRERERIDVDASAGLHRRAGKVSADDACPRGREEWAPARPMREAIETAKVPEPVAVAAPAPPPVEVAAPLSVRRLDLQGIATLCGDLARVTDTRSLPGLLERTATLIDASGIVLWIADPDGRELAPDHVLRVLAPNCRRASARISREAENVTAAAFRTCLAADGRYGCGVRRRGGRAAGHAGGCVGVMAAEIRNEGEREDVVLAAAGIVAAQLATLVGPPRDAPEIRRRLETTIVLRPSPFPPLELSFQRLRLLVAHHVERELRVAFETIERAADVR